MKVKKDIIFWLLLILFIALSFFFGYNYYYKNYYLPSHSHITSKFSIADLKEEKLYYNASKEYVISVLGSPTNENTSTNEDTGDIIKVLTYKDCTALFSNNKLTELILQSPNYSFKGISIGDDVNKVTEIFYKESSTDEDNYAYSSEEKIIGKYIYGNFNIYNLNTVKTKEAIFYAYETSLKSENSYIIRYVYMCPPYINGYASIEDNATILTFEIENNMVSKISWRVGKAS